MKALLIEVDFRTGQRAGGIQARGNKRMPQIAFDDERGVEIRTIPDNDAKRWEGIEGVTVLNTDAEIDAEIEKIEQARDERGKLTVLDPAMALIAIESLKEQGIKISEVVTGDMTPGQTAKALRDAGARGVKRVALPRMSAIKAKQEKAARIERSKRKQ